MTNIKQKIMEVLGNFENANLSSEAAREVIADRLMKHIEIKGPVRYYTEDEYKEEQQKIGEALRQRIEEDELS